MARAKTFEEVMRPLRKTGAKRMTKNTHLPNEVERPATLELETLVAERIQANPQQTREEITHRIFSEKPELYERWRAETTVSGHGEKLKAIYARVRTSDSLRNSADEDISARVERLVNATMARTAGATRESAMAFVFREHPDLAEQWMRESYA